MEELRTVVLYKLSRILFKYPASRQMVIISLRERENGSLYRYASFFTRDEGIFKKSFAAVINFLKNGYNESAHKSIFSFGILVLVI